MPAIAFGLIWAGYTLGLWGYSLTRGYNVTLGQLADPVHSPSWSSITGSSIPSSQVFPGKTTTGTTTAAGGSSAPAPAGPVTLD
jgi:hypothetical protein